MKIFSYDILVIGAGVAGQMAALEAGRRGRRVAILSKVQPFRTHSIVPEGGINVALKAGDSWRQQADDIWNDGHFLSDWDALEAVTKEGPQIVVSEFREHLDKDERGEIQAYDFAGTPRAAKAGKNTGLNFVRGLYTELLKHHVQIFPDRVLTSLVVDSGECVGVTVFDVSTGEVEGYSAPSVILCSGGFGYLYQNTAHTSHMTGDGQALAYQAGVALKDMEFVRFHHTILYGSNYAITEGAFRKGMHLYNKNSERFMSKYDPLREETETYYLKRYMQLELDAGMGIENKYFFADFTHLKEEYVNAELPRTRRGCLEALGLDLLRDRLPVVPGVFMTIGGIATDVDGKTSVKGLYAAGECACAGAHGADWRVGNTLLVALVFGKRAGISASTDQRKVSDRKVTESVQNETKRLRAIASRPESEPYHLVRGDLRRSMSENATVVRDRERLERALETNQGLKRRYEKASLWDPGLQFNQQLVEFLELGNMLILGEAVSHAALARKESRGAHWRSDFPERDDRNWLCHSIQQHTADGPKLTHAPVQLGDFKPKEQVIIR
jgi:succinate dehydrogenase / fumarate reductase flavoprotein subunit